MTAGRDPHDRDSLVLGAELARPTWYRNAVRAGFYSDSLKGTPPVACACR